MNKLDEIHDTLKEILVELKKLNKKSTKKNDTKEKTLFDSGDDNAS